MKSFVQVLLFLAAFQLDLRVKASDGPQEPISEPPQCWVKKEGPCSVQVGRKALSLKSDELLMWADQDSLFSRENMSWKFLKGIVRAKSEGPSALSFPYGEIKLSTNGEFWIVEQGPRFVVRAVRGSVNVVTRDGRDLELPEGLEIWVGPVDGTARHSYGMPSLIPVEEHLKKWSRLEPNREKFIEEAKELRGRWQNRQEVASQLYGEVSKRHLASIDEEQRKEKAAIRAKQQEKEHYKKMLFERAFER